MAEDEMILLITGPNMSGKSTYMRQLALTVLMAQMGCFVPAKQAVLPIFDRIFTRIGASDDLIAGQSTFMVEMMEANQALRYATPNSLILFDELGEEQQPMTEWRWPKQSSNISIVMYKQKHSFLLIIMN